MTDKLNFSGQKIIKINKINGIRFSLSDGGWGLIRASSNTPNLVVVCESPNSDADLKNIFTGINEILSKEDSIGEYDQTL